MTIPDSVINLGDTNTFDTFAYCSSLTNIAVNAGNTNYASAGGVLFNKTLTTLIVYPAGLAGSYAIPDSVTNIDEYAFADCAGLTSVTINNSVTSIGEAAFDVGSGLTNIAVNVGNTNYASAGGVLFNKTLTTLIAYPGGLAGSYAIPDSVTSIGAYAFVNCHALTSVTIGNRVTSISDDAFFYCHTLMSVTIGNSVTSIGDEAFDECYGLTSVTIPDSVTSIGDEAFYFCSGLTSVTIGSGVTSIGDEAFEICSGLTNVLFQGNAPTLGGQSVFASVNASAVVYYYADTSGWGTTYGGLPTVELASLPSSPQIVANSVSVQPGNFGFTITGSSNQVVAVEASTNLVNWQPIQTNTLNGSSFNFTDSKWKNYRDRFYRLRSP